MLDLVAIRQQFPALQRTTAGRPAVYLDGPSGTQVPQRVIDAIVHYLSTCNANRGGLYATSQESDTIVLQAHQAMADFLGAGPGEIVFGQNMTSLTFHLSRALGRTWKPGDVVLVTRLDHDANIRPWVLAARDAGAEVRFLDIRPDGTLDGAALTAKLDGRVRLLALTCASNAIGTMPDVAGLTRQVHSAGGLVYLDAVHYAPHGPIDVRDWDCDFLACSAYKFFGPHVGVLWGRARLLEELPAYKVRPASDDVPERWMTGTQNHEGLAGVVAAVDYLASLGSGASRRECLTRSMSAIRLHETALARKLLAALADRPRFRVHGLTSEPDLPRRAPTVSITCADRSPAQVAAHLGARDIYVGHGNFYALELTERLGVEQRGGLIRLGLVHYNTADEVERLVQTLDDL